MDQPRRPACIPITQAAKTEGNTKGPHCVFTQSHIIDKHTHEHKEKRAQQKRELSGKTEHLVAMSVIEHTTLPIFIVGEMM